MTNVIKNSFKDKKELYVWEGLCPHCRNEIYLPDNIPFLDERYKCPNCKKTFTGMSMRGCCDLMVASGSETVTTAIVRKGRW